MDALMAFLTEGESEESNLGLGSEPITLKEFVDKQYLRFAAKPRLKNPVSYKCELNLTKALCKNLGGSHLHEIRPRDAEACKVAWLKEKRVNSTIKKRLNCLRRIMAYAESAGLIRTNLIRPAQGLPSGDRSSIWLKLPEIDRLLAACPPTIKDLVEYMVLTGARIGEALDFRADDYKNGKLYIPTEKQGGSPRDFMRVFDGASLGPRFARLMERLKPHQQSGFYFFANERKSARTGALSYNYFQKLFTEARKIAKLDHIRPHDLRGTFAMHRAPSVENFRQLQAELGHGDGRSVQSYLDRARQFYFQDSIFFIPPANK